MIQTMSGPNDWLQFYDQTLPTTTQSLIPSIPSTTNLTITTSSSPLEISSQVGSSSSTHLSPEGRVSKPTRRRSRASRRTPTTLLNTDTTNFRAMVQQFTGGPAGPAVPFAPTPSTAPQAFPNLMGFGLSSRPLHSLSPSNLMMSSPAGFPHLQQPQQQIFPPQNQQFNMYSSGGDPGGENTFFQRLSSNNPIRAPTSNVNVDGDTDGILNNNNNNNSSSNRNMDHARFFPSASSS